MSGGMPYMLNQASICWQTVVQSYLPVRIATVVYNVLFNESNFQKATRIKTSNIFFPVLLMLSQNRYQTNGGNFIQNCVRYKVECVCFSIYQIGYFHTAHHTSQANIKADQYK